MKPGRKPIKDKKQRVVLYIKESVVNKRGGQTGIRKYLYSKI